MENQVRIALVGCGAIGSEVLQRLPQLERGIVVVPVQTLLQRLPPRPKKPKPARPNKALWPWPLTTRSVARAKLIAAYACTTSVSFIFCAYSFC